MKQFGKFAAFALTLALASSAHAASITGGISIFGGASVNSSQTQITFSNPGTASLGTGTLALADGDSINMLTPLTASSTGSLFTTSLGVDAISFTIGSLSFTSEPNGQVQVNGSGTLSEAGFSDTAATFQLNTAANNGQSSFTLDSTVAPTPEPSSLILLGSGLVSGAGMLLRRRRSIA